MVGCSILGCKSRTERKVEGVTFHAFPKDPERKLKWIIATGKNNWNPTKFSKICSNHFIDDLIDKRNQRVQLLKGVVPTLHIHENRNMGGTSGAKPLTWKCRACLKPVSKKQNCVNIFQPWYATGAGKSIIAQDLAQLASIKVSEDDELQSLCEKCCLALTNAWQFIHTIRESDFIINQKKKPIEGEKIWPKPIQVNEHIKNSSVFGNAMEVEIKQELLSDDDLDEDEMEDGYNSDIEMSIKIEPEEMVTPAIKVTVNGTIRPEEMNPHNSKITNGSEKIMNEEFLDSTIKEEPLSEDDLIKSDLPTECQLCYKPFMSISGLKAHVIAHHSYKSVKRKLPSAPLPKKQPADKHVCATCKRCFLTQTDLMVHETCHNKSVCYSCNMNFDTFEQVLKHRKCCKPVVNTEIAKPKKLQDVVRPLPELIIEPIKAKAVENNTDITLRCTLCTETFSDTYYMKIHHEIHHQTEGNNSAEATNNKTKPSVSISVEKMETDALQHMFEQTETKENEKGDVSLHGNEQRDINSEVTEITEINKIGNNDNESEAVVKIEQNHKSDNDTEQKESATSNEEDIGERIEHKEDSVLPENSDTVVKSEQSANIEEEKSEAKTTEASCNQEDDCTLAMPDLETKDDTKSTKVIDSIDNEVVDTLLANPDPEAIQDGKTTEHIEVNAQEDGCGHLNMPGLDMLEQANSTEATNKEDDNPVAIVDTKPTEEISSNDPAIDNEKSVHAEPEINSTEENNQAISCEALDSHTPQTEDTEMIETNIEDECAPLDPEVTKTTEVLERNEQPEFDSKILLYPEMEAIMEVIEAKSAEDSDNKMETDTIIANVTGGQ